MARGQRFGAVAGMCKSDAHPLAVLTEALQPRASGATVGGQAPLSLTLHIPSCQSACDLGARNKVITKQHGMAAALLDVLAQEVALKVAVLGCGQSLLQLRLGGGTPTFLTDAELSRLMGLLRSNFRQAAGAKLLIEVDPRTATPDRLAHLANLGFSRSSFGAGDFDADVIALGTSAFGRMGAIDRQNAKTLHADCHLVRQGQFSVVRDLALTRDDLVRRAVVMALMCQGRIEHESIKLAHLVKLRSDCKPELDSLAELPDMGLCTLEWRAVQVTPIGRYFERAVAMVFDRHLQADPQRERCSRVK